MYNINTQDPSLSDELNRLVRDAEEANKTVEQPAVTGCLYGWICPKCGSSLAPFVSVCPNCSPMKQFDVVYCGDKTNSFQPQYNYTTSTTATYNVSIDNTKVLKPLNS